MEDNSDNHTTSRRVVSEIKEASQRKRNDI